MKKNFTLIELLIVIAIIAILAGIMMPALNQARGKARAIQCLSNLKSTGTFLTLYATDNRGFAPPVKHPANSGFVNFMYFMLAAGYASGGGSGSGMYFFSGGKNNVYVCPSGKPGTFDKSLPAFHYGYRVRQTASSYDDSYAYRIDAGRLRDFEKNGTEHSFSPSKFIMLGDSVNNVITNPVQVAVIPFLGDGSWGNYRIHARHANHFNAWTVDGRATSISREQFVAEYQGNRNMVINTQF